MTLDNHSQVSPTPFLLIDEGRWVKGGATKRTVWLEDAGKPWQAVIKQTSAGEIFLVTYHRINKRNLAALEKKKRKG